MESPPPPPSATINGRSPRVFSELDEIQILKCLIRATKSIPPPITTVGPQIISRIVRRLDDRFAFSQISDKVRRLRDKYHKHAKSKSLVRTHHDRRLFKLSKRIWGKKPAPKKKVNAAVEGGGGSNGAAAEGGGGGGGSNGAVANLDKFPYLVAEFSKVLPDNEVWREKMKGLEEEKLRRMDQDWIFVKVDEAKLVAKKAELIQQQIMEVMGETADANGTNAYANANED